MAKLKIIILSHIAIMTIMTVTTLDGQTRPSAKASWNPPRTQDGQPDMQGYWAVNAKAASFGAIYDLENGAPPVESTVNGVKSAPPQVIVDPPNGQIPYQPWARTIRDENKSNSLHPTKLEQIDSYTRCLQMGVPRQHFLQGFQVLQPPGYVIIVQESGSRTIPLDGRQHIGSKIKLWAGDSVGHWSENTLTVDVTSINEHGWYDWTGNFHSNELHLMERWTLLDANNIEYQVTSYDPEVFTKPWTIKYRYARSKRNALEFLEEGCYEGEIDTDIILGKGASERH
jgi:hypothetical protein